MGSRAKILRIYVDTSVIGGCHDEEFQAPSLHLVERSRGGAAQLVISDTTLAELAGAPPGVRSILDQLPTNCLEFVRQGLESDALAEEYIKQRVVSKKMLADASTLQSQQSRGWMYW